MEVLNKAVASQLPVKVHSSGSVSVVSLTPVRRSQSSYAFGLKDGRYVRISMAGVADLNGARNGVLTEFAPVAGEDGKLSLRGVRSGLWLTVEEGAFTSAARPDPLVLELDAGAGPGDGEEAVALPFSVAVVENPRKRSHVWLVTESGNLACGPSGKCHKRGKTGVWAQWEMARASQGASFKNAGHGRYLAVNSDGGCELADDPAYFATGGAPAVTVAGPVQMPPVDAGVLSEADKAQFREKGYVVLRGGVPPELVRDALRDVNHQLGSPGCWEADDNPLNATQLKLKGLSPEIGRAVFNRSPKFWSAVNVLLGAGNVVPWQQSQQIALRFPQPPSAGHDVPDVKPNTRYHVDGFGTNRLCPFSLLCGVALSDQTGGNQGNLHVFPGSHLDKRLHRYYRDLIGEEGQGEADTSKPDLGGSVQVLLQPGDVVLAHQLLAHRVGVNTTEHIRYQLYYRVQHKDHEALKARIIDDPWVEFAI